MCGRFSIAKEYEDVVARFQLRLASAYNKTSKFNISTYYEKFYNAAPSQILPVITNNQPQDLSFFRWGLKLKKGIIQNKFPDMINLRAENLLRISSFKKLINNQRCIIPADSFFEWHHTQEKKSADLFGEISVIKSKKKQPYRFVLKNEELFGFAGLWNKWTAENIESDFYTFAIITTEPNEIVSPFHNRMPVMLREEDEKLWLDNKTDLSYILSLLKPYESDKMKCYAVTSSMNNTNYNSSDAILPIKEN